MKHKLAALIHLHSLVVLAMMFVGNVDDFLHHAPVELISSIEDRKEL
jgi:hypothetical protein